MIIKDEKFLKQKCEMVLENEKDELIRSLEEELKNEQGIGLSAIQIGILKKAAIVRIPTVSGMISVNLINAKIEKSFDPFIFAEEGCLSFPNDRFDTKRYNEILVTNDVEPKRFVATGLLAVAIQHELDHLDGVLFFNHANKAMSKQKQAPNEACACGSGKKFKKCCRG